VTGTDFNLFKIALLPGVYHSLLHWPHWHWYSLVHHHSMLCIRHLCDRNIS